MTTFAAAAQSAVLAARAIESQLTAIAAGMPREGFPHSDLLSALPPAGLVASAVSDFIEDIPSGADSSSLSTVRATKVLLSSIHRSLQRIRSAVDWASDFTAIDWWVARRLQELGLAEKIVLVVPGPLGDFEIERTSSLLRTLRKLSEKPQALYNLADKPAADLSEVVDRLEKLHLLQVPSFDGISPAWRPLVLGHELAHLRYEESWARSWLSNLETTTGDQATEEAKRLFSEIEEGSTTYTAPWVDQLARWLVEVACDSVTTFFYAGGGRDGPAFFSQRQHF